MKKTSSVSRIVVIGAAMAIMLGASPSVRTAEAKENPANDCLVGLQGPGASPDVSVVISALTVSCTDGDSCDDDGATNGSCAFKVRGCVNIPGVSGCALRPIKKVKFNTGNQKNLIQLQPSATEATSVCGAFVDFKVDLKKKGKKPGKRKIIASATANVKPNGKNKDKDKVTFVCNPCPTDNCGSTTTTTLPQSSCSANAAGGPDQLTLTIADSGTDLDNGWTGSSHNFPLVPNGTLKMCLTNCDGTTDTSCDASGSIGDPSTSLNGVYFGAPLPLLASNVPVCVVSRWRDTITGTVDSASGDTSLSVKLFSDIYLTDTSAVCPQCKSGKCNGGKNAGKSCTVEATLPVYVSANRTDQYELSSTCVPNSPTATLNIDFVPLTSGTSNALNGDTPCVKQPGQPTGVPPKKDSCGAGTCQEGICTGTACVTMAPDPTNPAQMICIDSKGGLSQACCSNSTQTPCFLRDGNGDLTRTGKPGVPQEVTPGTPWPKTHTGVLASTFCIPATGTNTIDSVTGLPGPGTILLNGTGMWTKQ